MPRKAIKLSFSSSQELPKWIWHKVVIYYMLFSLPDGIFWVKWSHKQCKKTLLSTTVSDNLLRLYVDIEIIIGQAHFTEELLMRQISVSSTPLPSKQLPCYRVDSSIHFCLQWAPSVSREFWRQQDQNWWKQPHKRTTAASYLARLSLDFVGVLSGQTSLKVAKGGQWGSDASKSKERRFTGELDKESTKHQNREYSEKSDQ